MIAAREGRLPPNEWSPCRICGRYFENGAVMRYVLSKRVWKWRKPGTILPGVDDELLDPLCQNCATKLEREGWKKTRREYNYMGSCIEVRY